MEGKVEEREEVEKDEQKKEWKRGRRRERSGVEVAVRRAKTREERKKVGGEGKKWNGGIGGGEEGCSGRDQMTGGRKAIPLR